MGPRSRSPLVGVVLVAAVLASACSSAGESVTEQPTSPPPTTSAVTPTPTPTTTPTATPTPTPEQPDPPLSLATLNVLHGLFCAPETDWCSAPARIEILWEHVEAAGCPDVIALQEIAPRQAELIPDGLAALCGGAYVELLYEELGLPDQEMILTSLEVSDDGFVDLAGFPWTAHWALLEAELGSVLVVTTHFASSDFNFDCDAETCPPELCPAGTDIGTCNAIQVLGLADEVGGEATVQLIVGDLNKPLGDPRIDTLTDAGFIDAWTAAGNAECDPVTGAGCTCCVDGPEGAAHQGLEIAAQKMDRRIDLVLARSAADCELEFGAEGFASQPLAEPLGGLVWASDHAGVHAQIHC